METYNGIESRTVKYPHLHTTNKKNSIIQLVWSLFVLDHDNNFIRKLWNDINGFSSFHLFYFIFLIKNIIKVVGALEKEMEDKLDGL